MSDISETVNEAVERAPGSALNTTVAACVAVAATFMALCNVKDGNIVQAMAQAQAKAVDEWSYYQAKSTKQNIAETAIDELTLQRDTLASSAPEARALYDKKIATYASQVKRYDAEKDEIKAKAEAFEKSYDDLNVHDDQFDMAEACLSVAIALFGVTALTQKRWLLLVAGAFATFGTVLGVAGFSGANLHPDFLARLLG